MKKIVRLPILLGFVVSFLTSFNIKSMSDNPVADVGIPISPEYVNKVIEDQVAARFNPLSAGLEGKMEGYSQAMKTLGSVARKSSWMPSLWTMGKVGLYLGAAGGIAYAGYCAYKKFQWLRDLVGKIHNKVRGAAQNWLDITWIKERLSGITNRIAELAEQIAGLKRGQEIMQKDLEKIGTDTQGIMSELQAGAGRDEEMSARLETIEQKLDTISEQLAGEFEHAPKAVVSTRSSLQSMFNRFDPRRLVFAAAQ